MESSTQWLPAPPSPAAEPPVPFVYEPGPVQPDDTKGQDGRSQSWLRRKLGETAASPRYLHVMRGAGVKLVDPGE